MRVPFLVVAMLGALACSGTEKPVEPARLSVEWTGSDTGKLSAPATAEWCDSLRLLEIQAVQGDSGLALALYPTDTIRADSYPVLPPTRADSAPPAAAVALRWFAETAIKGFRSDSGTVVVETGPGQELGGRFVAHVASVNDTGRLTLRGTFRGLSIVPAARGCILTPPPEEVDTF